MASILFPKNYAIITCPESNRNQTSLDGKPNFEMFKC